MRQTRRVRLEFAWRQCGLKSVFVLPIPFCAFAIQIPLKFNNLWLNCLCTRTTHSMLLGSVCTNRLCVPNSLTSLSFFLKLNRRWCAQMLWRRSTIGIQSHPQHLEDRPFVLLDYLSLVLIDLPLNKIAQCHFLRIYIYSPISVFLYYWEHLKLMQVQNEFPVIYRLHEWNFLYNKCAIKNDSFMNKEKLRRCHQERLTFVCQHTRFSCKVLAESLSFSFIIIWI